MSAVAYNGNLFGTSFDPWQYSGNVYDNSPAGTTTFPLVTETGNPIDYLKRKHIHVYTSVNQGITWVELPKDTSWDFGGQGTEVVLNTGIADGEWIKVQRITPFEDLYIEFQNSSKLTADQLNTGEKFSMFVDQELADGFLALVDRINHGAYVIISETPPSDPIEGQLWWDSNEGFPYIWYEDSTSKQWIRFNPPEEGPVGPPGPPGPTDPASILYTYPGGVEQTLQNRLEKSVFVDDFIPSGIDTATTNCSNYVQAAFDVVNNAGGGTVHFDGTKTYLIYATQTGGFGYVGGYIKSNVIVDGHNCKILFSHKPGPNKTGNGPCFRPLSTTTSQVQLIGAHTQGSFNYTVEDASPAVIGQEVVVRCVDNKYDPGATYQEAKYYYSAVITGIAGNTLTLDRPVPEDFDEANADGSDPKENPKNRRLTYQGSDGLPTNNEFRNLRLESYDTNNSESYSAIQFREGKIGRAVNIELIDAYILFRATEKAYGSGIKCYKARGASAGSKGWGINYVNCVGFYLEDYHVEAFQQSALQLESYSSGKINSITVVNNYLATKIIVPPATTPEKPDTNSSNLFGVFKVIQESTITEVNDLTILGSQGSLSTNTSEPDGALILNNTSNGGSVRAYRNTSVRTAGTPYLNHPLGVCTGLFEDYSRGIAVNLDEFETVEKELTFVGNEYANSPGGTGLVNYNGIAPRSCLILGFSVVIENEPNISNISYCRLFYVGANGSNKTPSQYKLLITATDECYSVSPANLQYSSAGILGAMNYFYTNSRTITVAYTANPTAGGRLVARFKIARVPGFNSTRMNSKPTN